MNVRERSTILRIPEVPKNLLVTKIRKTEATKSMQHGVRRYFTIQDFKGRGTVKNRCWEPIDDIGGCGKSFYP